MRATFFVITGFVGKPGYLSWDGVRALAAAGMEIGLAQRRSRAGLAVYTLWELRCSDSAIGVEWWGEELRERERCEFSNSLLLADGGRTSAVPWEELTALKRELELRARALAAGVGCSACTL